MYLVTKNNNSCLFCCSAVSSSPFTKSGRTRTKLVTDTKNKKLPKVLVEEQVTPRAFLLIASSKNGPIYF